MRKYLILFMALCLLVVGCSVQNLLENLEYETVEYTLPLWPQELPPLVTWRVEMYAPKEGTCYTKELLPQCRGGEFRVKKNSPFYVCAFPITGTEQAPLQFFKCAGAVYPWECTGSNPQIELSWTGGYSAYLMRTLIKAAEASGYKGSYVSEYIGSFNWLKLVQTLEQKQQESLENQESQTNTTFYNPWLLDMQNVLAAIAYENFSAVKLKASNIFSIELEFPVYSSYVPENAFCGPCQNFENGCISLSKNEKHLFMLAPLEQNTESASYALMIYGESEKKVSLEFISMPIYSEGI